MPNVQQSINTSSDLAGVIDMLDSDIDLIGTDSDDGVLAPESIAAKNEIKGEPKSDKPAKAAKTETPAEPKGPSKMDGARAIFVAEYGKSARKDIIAKFIEIGCTKAGAATYYQNLTKAVKDGKLVIAHVDADPQDESETE